VQHPCLNPVDFLAIPLDDGYMEINHSAEKDLSYTVRRHMGLDGRDGAGYAITLRAISNYAPDHPNHVTIPAGTRCHVRTTNAGFRGIEASATAPDGIHVHGVSLGAFSANF
jgi:hypothetical protein